MNIRLTLILTAFLTIAVFSTHHVFAEIELRVYPSEANVVAGDDVTVSLVLVDFAGNVDADGGLLGGGGQLLLADSSSATAIITDVSKISPNAGFAFATTVFPFDEPFPTAAAAGFSQLGGFVSLSDLGTAVPTVGGEILLAEFDITVTGLPGDSIELHPAVLGGGFAGNVGFSGTDFDSGAVLTQSATITIVPEPHSTWAAIVIANVLAIRRRRRIV